MVTAIILLLTILTFALVIGVFTIALIELDHIDDIAHRRRSSVEKQRRAL